MERQAFQNSLSRVWFQEGGPGSTREVSYHGNWKAGAVSWDRGDRTVIREPDPSAYGKFIRAGSFRGAPGDPELPITARYSMQRSRLLKAARADCEHALHVHMGQCLNPQDFHRGWEKVLILEGAVITSYGTEDLGAMDPGENAAVNEDVPFVGTDFYEVVPLTFAEQAAGVVLREVRDVYVCDAQQCGACGVASDGCQVVLAIQPGDGAAVLPSVIYTTDGGATWASIPISTSTFAESVDAIVCVGDYTVVLSSSADRLHYALTSEIVAGAATWTAVTTGFVATNGPTNVSSLGATDNWIAGQGGYIYRSDDLLSGVEVSDAGGATVEDLNDIHAYDSNNVVAVGVANAVVRTSNGGISWESIVGPAATITLNSVWMLGPDEWLVGTADGRLFATINAGATWVEKAFPGSGGGAVRDIVFVTPSVGYMAHNIAGPAGRILRTINGGYSWYVMPEKTGAIPANDYVAQLAVCGDANIVYGGGLAANGTDGFLVKGA